MMRINSHSVRGIQALIALGILGSSGGGLPAWAEPSDASSSDNTLEAVVVTAQRRSELLQDVPISLSVFSKTLMDEQGTRQIDDISRLTPGLTFIRGVINNNSESSDIAIRGIWSTAGTATTGIYIDDVPIQGRHLSFGTFNAYPQLFDIDRVEVLRGPQGTLFGSGSEGGTIRFITPEPGLSAYSVYARSELAVTDGADPVEDIGLAGGPDCRRQTWSSCERFLSSRRRLRRSDRLAHGSHGRPEFQREHDKNRAARPQVGGERKSHRHPVGLLSVSLCRRLSSWWSIQPGTPLPDPTGGQFNSTLRNGNEIGQPRPIFTLSAVRIDWNFGPVALVSSSSYYKRNQSAVTDYSSVDRAIFLGNPYPQPPPQPVVAPGYWADNQNNWTQEVRLESTDKAARINWTTGFSTSTRTKIPSRMSSTPLC